MTLLSLSQAQLWVGPDWLVTPRVQEYIQKALCPHNGCKTCLVCLQVSDRHHHSCVWFHPDGYYTLETLQPFFATIAHSLDDGQKFFFIFHHADYLSAVCTNKLLKSIEEPPPGYVILFLANNIQAIAPTLRSRCIIVHGEQAVSHESVPDLATFFTSLDYRDPQEFLTALDSSMADDRSTKALLDYTIHYWAGVAKQPDAHDIPRIDHIIQTLHQAVEKPPMPGSYKIFLKNLFLRLYA